MSRRAPSAPPQIPGFTHQSLLGSGGFADVFLYEQHRPRRKVAVKVLLASMLTPSVLRQFDAEADLMAQLSTHPSIVTIYEIGLAPDGRPFMAMEYCPRPNLGQRYKREPLGVPETLRIGIEIAGAVETAHRAGILHRDIKPQNILVSEYDRPLLTDFGIASTVGAVEEEAEGLSIPWSPPESFAEPPRVGVATDVWALGATVYSLLAGRSPFELPGRANGSAELITRIEQAQLMPIGRADVPGSLERVLSTSMGRLPEQRYPSAMAFARALQQVQTELGLGATPLSVLDDVAPVQDEVEEEEQGTRIRRIVQIDPLAHPTDRTAPPPRPAPPGPSPAAPAVDQTVHRGAVGVPAPASAPRPVPTGPWTRAPQPAPIEETVHRVQTEPVPDGGDGDGEQPPVRGSRWRAVLLAGVGLAAAGAVAVVVLSGGDEPDGVATTPVSTAAPVDDLAAVVPAPTELVGTVEGGQATFTWTNPDPQDGDGYLWRVLDLLGEATLAETAEPHVTIPLAESGETCVEVFLTRGGRSSQQPVQGCAG